MHFTRITRSNMLFVRPAEGIADGAADSLVHGLSELGYAVVRARCFDEAIAEAHAQEYPLILLDLAACARSRAAVAVGSGGPAADRDLCANDGLDLLRHLRRISPASQVVVLVAASVSLTTCCQAVTLGAASFIEWSEHDFIERVADRLDQAYARYEASVEEGRQLHSSRIFDETGVAGRSQLMAKLLFQAKRAAIISDAPILVTGESGTGKQLLAEAIHRLDPKRHRKPFITVNCAAITGSLAESALFGHRKGAFTGASEDRLGYFRAAGGGTILLDEISELEKSLQPKLLRVLQEARVLPVGQDEEVAIDVRVIAASNRPLPVLVEKGEFRLDLYQRLNVIALEIPPLRKRPEDVPLLVQFFLRRYADYYPYPIQSVDERVYEVLTRNIGSGNVRELENAIRQILAFKTSGTRIELSDIPPNLLSRQVARREELDVGESLASAASAMIGSGRMSLNDVLDEFEGLILREALGRCQGTHAELAELLGLSRRTFYNKLRKHDLPPQG